MLFKRLEKVMVRKHPVTTKSTFKNSALSAIRRMARQFCMTLLCLQVFSVSFAQYDGGVNDAANLIKFEGSQIFSGASLSHTVGATRPNELSRKVKNVISLSINEDHLELINDFTATVTVNVDYGASASSYSTLSNQALTVRYDKAAGAKYDPKQYVSFENAEYIKVDIVSVNISPQPASGSTYPLNTLVLKSEMMVTRYCRLDQSVISNSAVDVTSSTSNASGSDIADELNVEWNSLINAGNNGYQLEWTWVENELEPYYWDANNQVNTDAVFTSNSSRVDLSYDRFSYSIPLYYNGIGKLYYRVRPVNFNTTGSRTDGKWSPVHTYQFSGHGNASTTVDNNQLNWQVRTSFAEEGKRKSVMEYFDGSLRSRQTVTKDNSTNTTVVAETFYDGQGRPAIQVLPAPGLGSIIKYQQNLNVFNGTNGLPTVNTDPASLFDLKPLAVNLKISTASGSSAYYSPNNPLVNNNADKFIPNADGYPYTLTRYTPDATGRIMAQSGVGSIHQLESGHETKYYYGAPTQEELDALFGTEVGYSSHYFKNMVVDANGQTSISYSDMHGRTIATALAGINPNNLVKLNNEDASYYPGQGGKQLMSHNLLSDGNIIKNNNSIESVTTLLVPSNGNGASYSFNYQLNPKELQLPGCNATTICYDCLYDLEISITNESGEDDPIFVKRYSNISINPDYTCNSVPLLKDLDDGVSSNGFAVGLDLTAGSYTIRKTLSISEASLQKYKDEYLSKAQCETKQAIIDGLNNFYQTTTGCASPVPVTCESCNTALGSEEGYRCNYLSSIGIPNCPTVASGLVLASIEAEIKRNYAEAKARCAILCGETSQLLGTKRELMLLDMIPYTGQYALDAIVPQSQQLQGIDATASMFKQYNIFYTNSSNPQSPFYRNPKKEDKILPPFIDKYYDSYNQVDNTVHGDPGLLSTITPENFTKLFKDKWAEALLPYHPEYPKLLYAEKKLGPSYNWINSFSQMTLTQAMANNFFNTFYNIINADPFYQLTEASAYKTQMMDWVEKDTYQKVDDGKYVSLWRIAFASVMCKSNLTPPNVVQCMSTAPLYPGSDFYSIYSTAQREQIWEAFKSFYQKERDAHVNKLIATNVPLSNAQTLVNQHYLLHFPESDAQLAQQSSTNSGSNEWFWFPPPANGGTITPAAAIPESKCHSYIQTWKQTLLQCSELKEKSNKDAIIDAITSGMEAVCKKGTDAANSYGSSSIAPGAAPVNGGIYGTFTNFEDVINNVLAYHGISRTNLCNPYVIEFPKPYGKNPRFINEVTGVVDTCNCKQYAAIKQAMGNENPVYTEVNAYLKAHAETYGGDTLTQGLYSGLLYCSLLGVPSCGGANRSSEDSTGYRSNCDTPYYYSLPNPEPLPAFLECGFTNQKNCYSCAELSTLSSEFITIFSPTIGPDFTSTTLSDSAISTNVLYAKFINYRTGFQYEWTDYAKRAAASSCNLNQLNSGANQTVVCGSTQPITDPTGMFVHEDPCQKAYNMALVVGTRIYESRVQKLLDDLDAAYRSKCLEAQKYEIFTVYYANPEYHYTLYYYDQGGNLVKTVPPKAVIANYSPSYLAAVKSKRDAGDDVLTPYSDPLTNNSNPSPPLATNYRYNSLGQVINQKTPDAGLSSFWYDKLGRLVVSQNAQQKLNQKYSYTKYDALGRIEEVGQKPQTMLMTQDISRDLNSSVTLEQWRETGGGVKEQLTLTSYDDPFQPLVGSVYINQQNLRNRVSYTATKNLATDQDLDAATYYSYDIHGNIGTLLQDYNGISAMKGIDPNNRFNRYKRITYDYDLISGKVNQVNYQPDLADAFYHRYSYDAENRLTIVETSRDKIMWERDATYRYYKHGPLSRMTLGQLNVQGVDYAYTLQGWLKGVNSTAITGAEGTSCPAGTGVEDLAVIDRLENGRPDQYVAKLSVTFTNEFTSIDNDEFEAYLDPTIVPCIPSSTPLSYAQGDMGRDGTNPGNLLVARDAYGFSLNYFDGDYKAINASVKPFAIGMHNLPGAPSDGIATAAELFNGNIASMMVSNPTLSKAEGGIGQMVYGYRYDQLNRLVSMNAYRGFNNQTNTFTPVATDDYFERVKYDPNGNILSYKRNGIPVPGTHLLAMDDLTYHYANNTNQLTHITDAVTSDYPEDIDTQSPDNYKYDAIGNLTEDATNSNAITGIKWNVYGKIMSIAKAGGTITYTYDASGNRISKTVGTKTTVYVRDALGNVLALYEAIGSSAAKQVETHLYGSSRLGIMMPQPVSSPISTGTAYGTIRMTTFTRGEKFFELSNHLGNVLATVSDKKIAVSSSGTSVDFYTPDVVTATDYAPFGMPLFGRTISSDKYRYGFNGKENDNEVKSIEGSQQDYGMRIYDPRLGRFLSVDPISIEYPELTPYQFASNTPIQAIDLDGLEAAVVTDAINLWNSVSSWFNSPASAKQKQGLTYQINYTQNGGDAVHRESFNDLTQGEYYLMSLGVTLSQRNTPGRLNFPAARKNRTSLASPQVQIQKSTGVTTLKTPVVYSQPSSTFKGGAKGKLLSKEFVLEANHLPTVKSMNMAGFEIKYNEGSAFQMIYQEHRDFVSTGRGPDAVAFREREATLLRGGKFMEAFELTANRTRADYGNKYDNAINEAREYFVNNIVPQLQQQLQSATKK